MKEAAMKERLKTLAIPCAFALIAPLAAACHFDDDAGEGGCQPDTPGLEGRLIFDFMMTDEDVSQPNGKAFAAGTEAHMSIRPVDEGEPLPAWTIESDDENVITVDDILPEGSFPVVLGMREPGHTEVSVLEDEGGDLIDRVQLSVAEPEGLGVFYNHPFLYEVPLGDTVLIPASDGYCVLSFFPFDTYEGEQRYLYGEYSLDVDAPGTTFDFTLIPIGAVDTQYAQRDTFTVEIRATAEGSESVTFTGPRGHALTREVRTAVASDIDAMTLEINSVLGLGAGEYVSEYGFLVALQHRAGSALCGGFPVTFESDNPDVVLLGGSFPTIPNAVQFELAAVGTAAVTAVLDADPSIRDTMTFVVTEAPEEE
jgi:hypothetical protein